MAEELKYRISFTKGSLAGHLFPLGDEPVIVGRSHTCGIRVMEPDVSGRHVMLSVGPRGVGMEVISSRRTMLDGKALKTGDKVQVRAGQSVAMGGNVAFSVECYRSEGDRTEAPGDWPGGMTRFGADAGGGEGALRRPGEARAGEETSMTTPDADDDTGTHIPPPSRSNRPTVRPDPPTASSSTSPGTVGTIAAPPFPPPSSGGETFGAEGLPPSADATQIIQTRAATPQEMAYMRELHNKKRRRKLGVRLGLGGGLAAIAAGICIWLSWQPVEQFLEDPPEREGWILLDGDMKPVPRDRMDEVEECLFVSYPASGGWGSEETTSAANPALGTEETEFTVRTRVGRNLDVPLQLRLVAYASPASLDQSQEEAFADWDRTRGQGIEKQAKLANDFFGENPGIPCLRYTYTRKASQAEESSGVLDWAGVLSFFRFRDTCCVYFREVPSVEEIRAEHMLLPTDIFLGITEGLVERRWTGLASDRQHRGKLPVLRNSAKELLGRSMDNEWEELEDKLATILIRTFPRRQTDSYARLYEEAEEWMATLHGRQAETWKKRWVTRSRVPEHEQDSEGKRQDEGIRALFRSPDDRRHYIAQREDWWQP